MSSSLRILPDIWNADEFPFYLLDAASSLRSGRKKTWRRNLWPEYPRKKVGWGEICLGIYTSFSRSLRLLQSGEFMFVLEVPTYDQADLHVGVDEREQAHIHHVDSLDNDSSASASPLPLLSL